MKPTVQAPDFYDMGNDYAQAPLSSYYDMTGLTLDEANARGNSALAGEPKFYQDGIFTKLNPALDGWKDEAGFNKRRVFVGNDDAALAAGDVFGMSADGSMNAALNEVQPAVDDPQYGEGDIVEIAKPEA